MSAEVKKEIQLEIAHVLFPGRELDRSKLPAMGEKLDPKLALVEMVEDMKAKKPVNGWLYWTSDAGSYGTDYAQRAMVTLIGPGLNYPQDAVYPFSEKDEHGEKYDGASHKYVMHFDKGQMPPVKGFWSLTHVWPGFLLRAALHQPTDTPPTILDGSWKPPAIRTAKYSPTQHNNRAKPN